MTKPEPSTASSLVSVGDAEIPHRGRSFDHTPTGGEVERLLAEVADRACVFGPVAADRPLALYGAGNLGRLARDFLKAVGQDFTAVIDRDAKALANDPAWSGVRLLHPDDVPDSVKTAVRLCVSIANSPYVPLEQALIASGFADVAPFYDLAESFRGRHPLSNGWFAPPLSRDDRDKAATVLARWDDDVSRAHHLQFLAWRRLREEWTFAGAPVAIDNRFFIPEVTSLLHDDEVFLDAGAHFGSVTATFVRQVGGAFRRIVAVEPDRLNRIRLVEALRTIGADGSRVGILQCALGEDESEAPFHDELGYASQLSPTGVTRAKVRPLDAFDLAPTFIKLHLEGGELAALKGGRQTLSSSRPIIAATVYHNADGIWKTPLWLMETLPDYRFLFRAHSWCGTGAVVYAIPDERRAS